MSGFESKAKSGRQLQKSHLSGIRTVRSPSPLPSPSGRGSIYGSAFENSSRLELLKRGPRFSLFPEGEGRGEGERALGNEEPWEVLQLPAGFRISEPAS